MPASMRAASNAASVVGPDPMPETTWIFTGGPSVSRSRVRSEGLRPTAAVEAYRFPPEDWTGSLLGGQAVRAALTHEAFRLMAG